MTRTQMIDEAVRDVLGNCSSFGPKTPKNMRLTISSRSPYVRKAVPDIRTEFRRIRDIWLKADAESERRHTHNAMRLLGYGPSPCA